MVSAASRGDAHAPIVAGLPDNRQKAWRIAHGEDPNVVLRGPKVRAFFANITGDHDSVTVDVWAARAAEDTRIDNSPSGARYAAIARAYQLAAVKRGVSPREMQAAVWVHIRGAAEGNYSPSAARIAKPRIAR